MPASGVCAQPAIPKASSACRMSVRRDSAAAQRYDVENFVIYICSIRIFIL